MSKIINVCEQCGREFEAQDSDQELCDECQYYYNKQMEEQRFYDRLDRLREQRHRRRSKNGN